MPMLQPTLRKAILLTVAPLVYLFFLSGLPLAVYGQDSCTEELTLGEERYNLGRFDEVIDLINTCLAKEDVPEQELRQAYRLMGLSYLGKRLESDARASIRQLLELVPSYEPDPNFDPPPFITMIENVRMEMEAEIAEAEDAQQAVQPRKKRWRKWLLIGGAIIGGSAIALALSGGGGGGQIAPPPSLPGSN